jgi:hypothetical protein
MFCAPALGLDGDACTSDGQCDSGVCSAGECFTPPTVGGGMIIVGPGAENPNTLPPIVGPGGLNPLGPDGLPPIVGPGGLAPGLCFTDFDCDEGAGEVCDAGECFLP